MKVGEVYKVSNFLKKTFKEVVNYNYDSIKGASLTRTWRFGSIIISLTNESDAALLKGSVGNDYFSSEGFSKVDSDIFEDIVEEEWGFENPEDYEKFQNLFDQSDGIYSDLQEFLEDKIGFAICERYFEVEYGGVKIEDT